MSGKTYLCIDLKSCYASVECIERGLDPMTTNLVVADSSRTEKTICLAVTPSLKAYGIPGRARLFEVVQKVKTVNDERKQKAPEQRFLGESYDAKELLNNPSKRISYLVAPPRMAHYIEYSTRIYNIYLKYIAPEDIHVYSIDEVFMDITSYLKTYQKTPHELAMTIIKDVLDQTGITATAGIGTNMYLAKIAMDIVAKHIPPDEDGVRIARLDEIEYRKKLWNHRPLTDFWRIGKGYSNKLEENRLYTMGDIARCSLNKYGEDKLYKLFGVNAELLIDHAWGWEPCTIAEIKAYKPQNRSLCSGQVLKRPYNFNETRLVVREMLELLALDLVDKRVLTDQIVLTVGYDIENLTDPDIKKYYKGEIKYDNYGRKVPKPAHGTANIKMHTSSANLITEETMKLFDQIVDDKLLVRRLNISANHIIYERELEKKQEYEQLDIFTDYDEQTKKRKMQNKKLKNERAIQEVTLELQKRYGKNAILKGYNLQDSATTKERNEQIGGHKA